MQYKLINITVRGEQFYNEMSQLSDVCNRIKMTFAVISLIHIFT